MSLHDAGVVVGIESASIVLYGKKKLLRFEASGDLDRIRTSVPDGVLNQFAGKSAADGTLNVGSNVDAISGATVSSKGVTAGVNAAIAVAGVLG